MITGVVWHYWIAVPLVALTVAAFVAIVALYLRTVTRPRYPRQ